METLIFDSDTHIKKLEENGFTIIDGIYTSSESNAILQAIASAALPSRYVVDSKELFAIRQFLKRIPGIKSLLLNKTILGLIRELFGNDYFIVKSIYFNKPEKSNWFVAYHQDLTISVKEKADVPGFLNRTSKEGHFTVQLPVALLEKNFTIRIHLDDTNAENGALKVIPGSHKKEIIKQNGFPAIKKEEIICAVRQGGIMIMRPLLLHASSRTQNGKERKVIHIECSNSALPENLSWSEYEPLSAPE